jgi:HEAT repeat protein
MGCPPTSLGLLAERLSDPVSGVRWQAAVSLARFRKEAQTVVPLILRGLGDSEASVRRAAIDSLRRFGPQAEPALADLRALAERDVENRTFAIECIRGIDWAEADRLAAKFRVNR